MSSSFGSLLHLFRSDTRKNRFNMLSGYQKLGLLVLSSFLLVILAEADVWHYSDVDLRIAERKVIPHYVRHSYEYPDIDIKKIMQQRGIQPKPYNPSNINRGTTSTINRGTTSTINRGIAHHQIPKPVHNRNRIWMSHRGKTQAMSNHLEPQPNRYHLKKFQHYSKNMRNFHHNDKFKVKNRYQ